MTHNIFFISDHHLGQRKILTFRKDDNTPLRDFSSLEEMHEHIIDRHNSVVRQQDKVYFLGDVCFDKQYLPLLDRFKGKKRLVRGNHDVFGIELYALYFEEIHGCRVFTGLPNKYSVVATHVPVHPQCMSRWTVNVHGHLHYNQIQHVPNKVTEQDLKYFNVCVDNENTGYTPVSMDELITYVELFKGVWNE